MLVSQIPKERAMLALLAATQFCLILDAAVIGVALPAIARDLGFGRSALSWVVSAYILAFGGFLLLGGRAADRLGRRRVFAVSAALFAGASAVGAVAQSDVWLVAARAGQGLAAAFMSPAALSLLLTVFEDARSRQHALGIWTGVSAAGGAAGFLVGGVLVEAFGWRSVMYANVPLGIAIAWLAPRLLPASAPVGAGRGFDIAGAASVTAGLGLGIFALIHAGDAGWTSPATLVAGTLAAILLATFVVVERRTAEPLVPLAIFLRRSFSTANGVAALVTMAVTPMFFFLTLFMQNVLGYSALAAGLAQLPLSVVISVAAIAAPRLIGRVGIHRSLAAGLGLLGAGMLVFARLPDSAGYVPDIVAAFLLAGPGAGIVWVAATAAATAGADASDSGLYSGIVSTAQQLGSAIGLAILATVAAHAAGADPSTASMAGGLRVGFGVAAGLIASALALTVVVLVPSARRSALPAGGAPAAVPARAASRDAVALATEAGTNG
jgi:EmrB/QacA subfamily drug resistance transporter